MKRSERTKMTMLWRRVSDLLDKGDKVRTETKASVDVILKDDDHSDSWKRRMVDELRKAEGEQYKALGEQVYEIVGKISEMEQAIQARFDYASPRLTAALQFVDLMGQALPFGLRDRIVEDFRGDGESLRCIQAKYKAAGFSTVKVDKMLEPFTSLTDRTAEVVGEMHAYAVTDFAQRQWRSAGVRDVMGRAMETYGLDFKSSPVLAELEAIKASTSDAHKAATIEAWIKRNGGQVYEEFNNGISETTEAAELFLSKMTVGEADD